MCNRYQAETTPEALQRLTGVVRGAQALSVDIFPDQAAPVVGVGRDGARSLTHLRWGMPTPTAYLKTDHDPGVTNIRNTASPHWARWLAPRHRCVVPATAFSEYGVDPVSAARRLHWFALDDSRPVFAFAGLWANWHGKRRAREGAQDHSLFAFLTCAPNAVVGAVQAKAAPVILTTPEQVDMWLTAPWAQARTLQAAPPDDALTMVPGP